MKLLLKLRIPSWLDEARGASVRVNGEEWTGCKAAAGHMAGSFCTVDISIGEDVDCAVPHGSYLNFS